jgi:succinate dehydrogenase/fumarate reductase flavoprotein subunit
MITTDVIVMGDGISGISASLSAAEKGTKVIFIGKMDTFQARDSSKSGLTPFCY